MWQILKRQEQSFEGILAIIGDQLEHGKSAWLLLLLLLVPVNWALESRKWQLLVSKVMPIRFGSAVRSTLAGLVTGLVLPAQIGDAVGRVAALDSPERPKTVGAAVISGGIQFYTSVFAGIWALYFLHGTLQIRAAHYRVLQVILWGIVVLGIAFFLWRKKLLNRAPGTALGTRVREMTEVTGRYRDSELLTAFAVGGLRYAVYMGQYVAGLVFFGFPLTPAEMAASVALILMVKTVLPAVSLLGDLGLRGITALYVFERFSVGAGLVMSATLLVWLTNILIPAVAGLVLIWFYRKRSEK